MKITLLALYKYYLHCILYYALYHSKHEWTHLWYNRVGKHLKMLSIVMH